MRLLEKMRRVGGVTLWSLLCLLLAPLVLLVLWINVWATVDVIVQTLELTKMREVTEAKVIEHGPVSDRGGRGLEYRYRSKRVTYVYEIDGLHYTSHRVAPGVYGDGAHLVRDTARELRPGKLVTIHYDKSNPARSCLKYGWPVRRLSVALFLWALCLYGIGIPKRSLRRVIALVFVASAGILYVTRVGLILPDVIAPSNAHWYAMAFAILCLAAVLVVRPWPRARGQRSEGDTLHEPSPGGS